MKSNKKGFTLAELLIVISIIAILISIAIPAFGGSLDNAKLQADHANMRNAYSMVQMANMQDYIEVAQGDGSFKNESPVSLGTTELAFQVDGTVKVSNSATNYKLQTAHSVRDSKCANSIVCVKAENCSAGASIVITANAARNAFEIKIK